MSKMSDYALMIEELRRATNQLVAAANAIIGLCKGATPELTDPEKPPATDPEPKPVTLVEVRAVLAEKSRDGYTDAIRALLEKHGASKLSEIDPANYAALLADAEVLGSA